MAQLMPLTKASDSCQTFSKLGPVHTPRPRTEITSASVASAQGRLTQILARRRVAAGGCDDRAPVTEGCSLGRPLINRCGDHHR
jgi:hypothetical protein